MDVDLYIDFDANRNSILQRRAESIRFYSVERGLIKPIPETPQHLDVTWHAVSFHHEVDQHVTVNPLLASLLRELRF